MHEVNRYRKIEEICIHFLTQTHIQNMGQDNNSPAENVYNEMSGTMRSMDRKREEMHVRYNRKHILKIWDKTTTHLLRMHI